MNDILAILKMVPYLMLIPIALAIPLVIFGKISNIWIESDIEKMNKMSLILCLAIILLCLFNIFLGSSNLTRRSLSTAFIWLVTSLHFSAKAIRNQGGFKTNTLSSQKSEAFRAGFTGAWRSRYHRGTIVQVLAIADNVFLQIK